MSQSQFLDQFFGLKHLSTSIFWSWGSSSRQCDHCIFSGSSMRLSQLNFLQQRYCSSGLAFIVQGAIKPSGSYSKLTTAKISCLVIVPFCTRCWRFPDALQINLSASMHHFNPSAHSVGNSCISRFATETPFSVFGISAGTLLSLLNNLGNLNLPFTSSSLSCVESHTAVVGVAATFIKSST